MPPPEKPPVSWVRVKPTALCVRMHGSGRGLCLVRFGNSHLERACVGVPLSCGRHCAPTGWGRGGLLRQSLPALLLPKSRGLLGQHAAWPAPGRGARSSGSGRGKELAHGLHSSSCLVWVHRAGNDAHTPETDRKLGPVTTRESKPRGEREVGGVRGWHRTGRRGDAGLRLWDRGRAPGQGDGEKDRQGELRERERERRQ